VNNPTLGDFCLAMLGRADIEESKSGVAAVARPPQASYPCGNFSDTSRARARGSPGPRFRCTPRARHAQADICPCAPRVVSIPPESAFGRLRCRVAGVPPQPNSPSGRGRVRRARQWSCRSPTSLRRAHGRVGLTRVKLNRVFFPRCGAQARSLGCRFARRPVGTVGISLLHSCASLIR